MNTVITFSNGLTATKLGENMDGSTGFYSVFVSGWGDPLVAVDAYLLAETRLNYHDPRIRVISRGIGAR